MPEYRYECVDNNGKRIRGRLEAESREGAVIVLREQGLIPTLVQERGSREPASAPGFGSVSVKRLAIYTRKFATLVRTDIRLSEVFEILGEEEEGRLLPEASRYVASQIAHGTPLDEAMAQRPRAFSKLYIKMIMAGMNSGTLDLVAENLAKLYESENALRHKIKGRLVYPFALLGFCFFIALVTRFFGVLNDAMFSILMLFWLVFIGLVIFGMTRPGYSLYRKIGFMLPGIGGFMRKINLARFCRIFGLQYAAGISILEGLEVSKEILQDSSFSKAVGRMQDKIGGGMDLREAMVTSGVFPSRMVSMIGVGERAGGVEGMLEKLAEYYEVEIDTGASILSTVIYFVVYMAVLVTGGIIVISLWGSYFGMIDSLIEGVP